MSNGAVEDSERDLRIAQLTLQNELLRAQIQDLRDERESRGRKKTWLAWISERFPSFSTLLAIASFWSGFFQYNQNAEREFMKPWLETQRQTYAEALSAVSRTVYSATPEERKLAELEFWRLYQGKMILVETKPVSGSMKTFGKLLKKPAEEVLPDEWAASLRALASVMQQSLAETGQMTYQEFARNQFKYSRQ
ncbi:MAG: hypothetical protein JSS02_19535 [Planctomycetes bacterium]|nr:hypothetical protein [Planctomycetota bacterium]